MCVTWLASWLRSALVVEIMTGTDKHLRKLQPYLLEPYGEGTAKMGSHPLSDTRAEGLVMGQSEVEDHKATGFAKLMQLRKISTLPSSKSISYVAQVDPNLSYTSSATMHNDRIKHYRPPLGPRDRFDRSRPPLTSHEIGWFAEEKALRKPLYPICSSAMTKFFDNMAQMSHMKKR